MLDDLEHRRFEVQRFAVSLDKKDTLRQVFYCTLLNERGNWRVVWAENIFSIAEAYRKQGEIKKAKDNYQKVLEYDPYFAPSLLQLGWLEYFEFNHYSGWTDVENSFEFNPLLVENQILLAYIYCAEGKISEAEKCFQLALELQEKLGGNEISGYLHRSSPTKPQNPYYEYSSEILLRELNDDETDAPYWFWGFEWRIDNSVSDRVFSYDVGYDLKRELREFLVYYNQKRVFAILARCELDRYIEQSQKDFFMNRKLDYLLFEAQEHIEFALEIESDNDIYLRLSERIKQRIKSLEKWKNSH